jgi:hypothetical protein
MREERRDERRDERREEEMRRGRDTTRKVDVNMTVHEGGIQHTRILLCLSVHNFSEFSSQLIVRPLRSKLHNSPGGAATKSATKDDGRVFADFLRACMIKISKTGSSIESVIQNKQERRLACEKLLSALILRSPSFPPWTKVGCFGRVLCMHASHTADLSDLFFLFVLRTPA